MTTTKYASPQKRGRPRGKSLMGHGADRSQTVTVRLTPRLRYMLELMARSQHRTVSSVVEWAVEYAMPVAELQRRPDLPISLIDIADTLWHPDEGERLDILGRLFPYLLTHDEHIAWLARQREASNGSA